MAKPFILVVDDEEDIRELVSYNLQKAGFHVESAGSGEKALRDVRARRPDLIVLDLMLPGMDGLDVCRALKSAGDTSAIPIVILSAKGGEADIVAGLELGADDYLTKPFSPRVLEARVRAVLRRRRQPPGDGGETIRAGELVIEPQRHEVRVAGQPVELTNTEFRILHHLARRPGWVFTRRQIVDATQGDNVDVTGRAVDVHIVSLRRKLASSGDCIETIRGVGYRFRECGDE